MFTSCTCAIIKPHIVAEGKAGKIIDIILSEGFEISSMQMFYLDRPTAEEFLEVYKVRSILNMIRVSIFRIGCTP
jgi:nucleoside-diphosphate kinase